MEVTFKASTIIGFALSGLFGYAAPIVLWIVWKRKTMAMTFPLVAGIIAYIIISLFRGIARMALLSESIRQDAWLFSFVTALISGVSEEVGRYVMFRYAIFEYSEWEDAVSCGIGHGGFEIIAGAFAGNFILAMAYKLFGIDVFITDSSDSAEETLSLLQKISGISFWDSMTEVLSCASAMAFHIAMAVLVFMAVHYARDKFFLIAAVTAHTVVDFLEAMRFCGDMQMFESTVIQVVCTAVICYFVNMLYCKYRDEY